MSNVRHLVVILLMLQTIASFKANVIPSGSNVPSLTMFTSPSAFEIGGEGQLCCSVEPTVNPTSIKLYKGDKPLKEGFENIKNKYQINYIWSSITQDDSGTYTCIVNEGTSQEKKQDLHVDVFYGPRLTVTWDGKMAAEGEVEIGTDVSIRCQVDAKPMPYKLHWIKKGDPHSLIPGSDLKLDSVTLESAGTYVCEAANTIGYNTRSNVSRFELKVLRKEQPGRVRITPSYLQVTVGHHVTLICTANSTGWPAPQFTWTKVPTGQIVASNSQLIFQNTQLTDAGLYRCHVNNTMGQSSNEVQLDVIKLVIDVSTPSPEDSANANKSEPLANSVIPAPQKASFNIETKTLTFQVQSTSNTQLMALIDYTRRGSDDWHRYGHVTVDSTIVNQVLGSFDETWTDIQVRLCLVDKQDTCGESVVLKIERHSLFTRSNLTPYAYAGIGTLILVIMLASALIIHLCNRRKRRSSTDERVHVEIQTHRDVQTHPSDDYMEPIHGYVFVEPDVSTSEVKSTYPLFAKPNQTQELQTRF